MSLPRHTSCFKASRRSLVLTPGSCRFRPLAHQCRPLHYTSVRRTDGVFRDLSEGRMQMPWIDALNKQRNALLHDAGATTPEKPKRDLTPKKMSDSFHSVILPLAQDKWLSDQYLNVAGHIRLGTVFMDLDALSGIIAYKHTGDGVTTVTAAVDRVTIKNPLNELCDLEYSGQVTYASGRSSIEVTCSVARAPSPGRASQPQDVLLTITFSMVSLDPDTKRPVQIPALALTSPEEEGIFRLGEARSRAKKSLAAQSLLAHEPNASESALLHRIWLHQVAAHDPHTPTRTPANATAMSKTVLRSASIMQPQYRNRHNFMIFGGFLLKTTFELAFCCCASFAHARPTFVSADPCTFLNPVPVGSVLYLTATVVYTDPPLVDADDDGSPRGPAAAGDKPVTRVSVRVDSKVRDVEHGASKPTGQFHYTFTVDSDVKVMPESYQEHMIYIDGRRRSKQVAGEMEAQAKSGENSAGKQNFTE